MAHKFIPTRFLNKIKGGFMFQWATICLHHNILNITPSTHRPMPSNQHQMNGAALIYNSGSGLYVELSQSILKILTHNHSRATYMT